MLWPWPWTERPGSCTRHVVLIWWSFMPIYSEIPSCITKFWTGHENVPYTHMSKIASARCDLDLGPSDMVLARDTSSLYDDHSCQFILKSHHAQQSYEPDTNIYIHYIHIRNMWNFQVPAVTLTLDRATWFLHATRRLDMMIIHANLFRNPIHFPYMLYSGKKNKVP